MKEEQYMTAWYYLVLCFWLVGVIYLFYSVVTFLYDCINSAKNKEAKNEEAKNITLNDFPLVKSLLYLLLLILMLIIIPQVIVNLSINL